MSASTHKETGPTALVGIGASAGGLEAVSTLLEGIPDDSTLAFIVVIHHAPDVESHLHELLQRNTGMRVHRVEDRIPLNPATVYVIPPGRRLGELDTHVGLADDANDEARKPAPIDQLFYTLAGSRAETAGVILTGTGSDGTLGIKAIKENGGLTIVQEPNDAEYDGMPASAIATGIVDLVLPLRKIPKAIVDYYKTAPRIDALSEGSGEASKETAEILGEIFAQVRSSSGRDFSRYKRSTILRRIQRRMQLRQIERLGAYLQYLRTDDGEVRSLADDFLIVVTDFFRDPEVFEELGTTIIPDIMRWKTPQDTLRVWSAGCATGEEAYSLAILLTEAVDERESAPPTIQIFASDLHLPSLERARDGFFPGDIALHVSNERLQRFFVREKGGFRIRRELREQIIFAPHNLLADPPFSRLDLIVCRNVLIYLQRQVQHEVIELFHYALRPGGLLLLGSSESVEDSGLFHTENKAHCLFRKRNVPTGEPGLPVFPLTRSARPSPQDRQAREQPDGYGELHRRLLESSGPPSLLLGPDARVVHLTGNASRFLQHPGGELTASVLKLIRPELRIELHALLHQSGDVEIARSGQPIELTLDGLVTTVTLEVRPAASAQHLGYALVIFNELNDTLTVPLRAASGDEAPDDSIFRELEVTRQRLRTVLSENEKSTEDMRAANEELQSTNEELRSTLEELETSKEELQSANEELQMVNRENRSKVDELARLTSDLNNLLVATDIATLFLDRNLRILRFTPKLTDLVNVRTTDQGRPISDLTHRLGYPDLESDARLVLQTLTPVEREAQDEDDNWYLTRILPYRSQDDRINGVVITFIDITTRKNAEETLRQSEFMLARELESMKRLHDFVTRLLVLSDLGQVLDEVLGASINITGTSMGLIQLYDPADDTLRTAAWRGFSPEEAKRFPEQTVADGASIETRAARRGERILADTLSESFEDLAASNAAYDAMQTTPLLSRDGALLGALSTLFSRDEPPSDADLRLLDLYARQACDFIEHIRAKESLRESASSLEERVEERTIEVRKLASRLTMAEQTERRRISQILHDDLQQLLYAVEMRMTLTEKDIMRGDNDAAQRGVDEARALVSRAISTTRALTVDLTPPILADEDLADSLVWLRRQMFDLHGLELDVHAEPDLPPLDQDLRVLLFQVVRELLFNVIKHADTLAASLSLTPHEGGLQLCISDEGKGFDPSILSDSDDLNFGLFSSRERIRLVGGSFDVQSSKGNGSVVTIVVPCAARPSGG